MKKEIEELNELLRVHEERVRQPELEQLSRAAEFQQRSDKPSTKQYVHSLAACGLNAEKLEEDFESRRDRLRRFKLEQVVGSPRANSRAEAECTALRNFARRHAEKLLPYRVYELDPLYRRVTNSRRLQDVKPINAADLLKERAGRGPLGIWHDPFHDKVEIHDWGPGWLYGEDDEVRLEWGFDFYPPQAANYHIFLKWAGFGEYEVYSDDGPWSSSEAEASMTITVHLGWFGPAYMHRKLDWRVFRRRGQNINDKGVIDVPVEYWETQQFFPGYSPVLVALEMKLYVYARSEWAHAKLDFDDPRWVNFTTWIVG